MSGSHCHRSRKEHGENFKELSVDISSSILARIDLALSMFCGKIIDN